MKDKVSFVRLSCQNCGADIELKKGKIFKCPYCGSTWLTFRSDIVETEEIRQDGYTKRESLRQHTIRRRDEMNHEERMRDMPNNVLLDRADRRRFFESENFGFLSTLGIFIGMPFLALIILTIYIGVRDRINTMTGKIHSPIVIREDSEDVKYSVAEQSFLDAGFTDVETVPLEDLADRFIFRSGKGDLVDNISIGGKSKFSSDTWFSKTDPVKIYYHSFEE